MNIGLNNTKCYGNIKLCMCEYFFDICEIHTIKVLLFLKYTEIKYGNRLKESYRCASQISAIYQTILHLCYKYMKVSNLCVRLG